MEANSKKPDQQGITLYQSQFNNIVDMNIKLVCLKTAPNAFSSVGRANIIC